MMEDLDLLKKDWKRSENTFRQLSEFELYKMIHKKSSSIVKWILVISILEFIILRGLDFLILFDDEYQNKMNVVHLYNFEIILTVINYIVLILFISFFYKNFKTINASSSVKRLMKDILKTRRIVKYYVWYNLFLVAVSSTVAVFSEVKNNSILNAFYSKHETTLYLISFGIIVILFLVFWVFYKLLYGILLRKLNENYFELKKIDVA
ncbi:hypothetical protein [Flavobacterium aciduliphilum]|jgi:hypothetical protein|uniref:Uncharacterized protein n=1 Tax=Flavobacterium aciduliphilum TaxID=1101402 RepID=A0A328YL92_9FLAO|nr:hypothetical protein [Flavobacterium aciduliphilum]RAR70876.1 hypothetical protein CLV55_109130 [Flavobacterium aciduliphilum]